MDEAGLEIIIAVVIAGFILFELVTRSWLTKTVLKVLLLLPGLAELYTLRLLRRINRPEYVLTGQCHLCGRCCLTIVGNPSNFTKKHPRFLSIYLGYHNLLHNFEPIGRGRDNDEVIFSCRHLGPDHRCRNYRLRPIICRDFPLLPRRGQPHFIEGCGFSAERRVSTQNPGPGHAKPPDPGGDA